MLLICLFTAPLSAHSQDRILIITSGNNALYKNFQSNLIKKLQPNNKINQISIEDINQEVLRQYNLIITAGSNAAKKVSAYEQTVPVIYSFIPENDNAQSAPACKNKQCYKVYINQPIPRYIELFNTIFPSGKNLVLAVNKSNINKTQSVMDAVKKAGVKVKIINVERNSNIARIFINKLNSNDVLLALPDPEIYNTNTAKNIILSTYHSNVPIIAYSKSFAKAGALISLHSNIDHISDKTANIASKILNKNPLTENEFYPDDYSLEINLAVATSLNINIDTESVIKRKMK